MAAILNDSDFKSEVVLDVHPLLPFLEFNQIHVVVCEIFLLRLQTNKHKQKHYHY